MRIQTLEALICVEESGSIRAAAQRLHISQPALTVSIKQLEAELGAPLLVRTKKGVSLNRFGQAFMRHARLIVTESRKAREEIDQLQGRWGGEVRFSTSPAFALSVLPHAIRPFMKKYPQVMVHCRDGLYPGVVPALRAGAIEFALTPVRSDGIESDLVAEPLYDSKPVIVASRSHPLVDAHSLSVLEHSLWAFSTESGGPGAIIEEAFQAARLGPPRRAMICESLLALPSIVANSELLTTIPLNLFDRHSNELGVVAVKEPLPMLKIRVVRLQELPLTPAAQELIGWIRHAAQSVYGAKSGSHRQSIV